MFGWLRRRTLSDAGRYNRGPYRSASDDAPVDHVYTISCGLGGFGTVKIPWVGTSWEDARDSFLEYIGNHDEFAQLNNPEFRKWRSLNVRFNGQDRLLTFRTDWIAGFTVH